MRIFAGAHRNASQGPARFWKGMLLATAAGAMLSGCARLPSVRLSPREAEAGQMREVMERKDRVVYLSARETGHHKQILLLLHGATDDPSEMMEIARQWRERYHTFLYSYDYHDRVEKVASDLVREVKKLRADPLFSGKVTFVVYSYAAIVFRQAVISADERALFSDATLVQLVPTAGGSFWARGMRYPVLGWLAGIASKPSAAENPYGRLAENLWEGAGNERFYEVIKPQRMHTLLVEGDSHSLARAKSRRVQMRYANGIGFNVVTIPKSAGVTHEDFPNHPVALGYLRSILGSSRDYLNSIKGQLPEQVRTDGRWDFPPGSGSGDDTGYIGLWLAN